ncbi:MAG: hypothetical protein ACXVGB_00370 [Mycobacteriaceae bacterium]
MLSRAVVTSGERLGEHLAGAFGTSESYEKAYMPWDEMIQAIIEKNPEMYGEAELTLEGYEELYEDSDA